MHNSLWGTVGAPIVQAADCAALDEFIETLERIKNWSGVFIATSAQAGA